MRRRLPLLPFLAVLAGCSTEPRGLIGRLQEPDLAREAFEEAVATVRGRVVHEERYERYRLDFGEARPVLFGDGRRGAAVLLRGRGAPCGTGSADGGVEAPADPPADPTLQAVLILDPDGRPLHQVDAARCALALIDADGDGRAQELVRWRTTFDYSRPPFLAIHDLARLDAAPLLLVEFNAGRKPRKRGEPCARRGRWRLESDGAAPADIVVEESPGGLVGEVARFRWDPGERLWKGPRGMDGDFFRAGEDAWIGANFASFPGGSP